MAAAWNHSSAKITAIAFEALKVMRRVESDEYD